MTSRKLMVLTQSDISTVQGTTEHHYVINGLSEFYEVHLFAPKDPGFTNVHYHRLPKINLIPSFFWNNIFLYPFFIYHILAISPSILYTYEGFSLLGYSITRLSKLIWVVDLQIPPTQQAKEINDLKNQNNIVRSTYYSLQDWINKRTLPKAQSIITISKEIKNELTSFYRVSDNKITVIPLGVDTEKFNPTKFNSNEEFDQIDLVYLGSIKSFRGIDTVIKAISLNDKIQKSVNFHIVGSDQNRDTQDLKKLAKELGVSENITWHGYVNHEEVPKFLSGMNVAISPLPPHNSYQVSSPAKIFEYLSMGLPIICSDITPHQKILCDGETGFFFEPENPESLAKQLERILELNNDEWQKIRNSCREKALRNSWSEKVETIKQIIDS